MTTKTSNPDLHTTAALRAHPDARAEALLRSNPLTARLRGAVLRRMGDPHVHTAGKPERAVPVVPLRTPEEEHFLALGGARGNEVDASDPAEWRPEERQSPWGNAPLGLAEGE